MTATRRPARTPIDGVNHAPFAAFGGWSGAVNAAGRPEVKDAAYAFLSYMSQPEQSNVDVTIGTTGFNPYRTSQFENIELWEKAGMSEAAAESYLGAIKASLNSPNMVLDLRVPQNQHYQQVVLDTAVRSTSPARSTPDETVKQIERRAGTRSPTSSAATRSSPPTKPRSASSG